MNQHHISLQLDRFKDSIKTPHLVLYSTSVPSKAIACFQCFSFQWNQKGWSM